MAVELCETPTGGVSVRNAPVTLTTLIIDDETLEREKLRLLLEEEGRFCLKGECGEAERAEKAVSKADPDVVFVDVEMAKLDAADFVEHLAGRTPPPVVVVMAYEAKSLREFERLAFGYLLKPIDPDCLHGLLDRLRRTTVDREVVDRETLSAELRRLATELRKKRRYPEQITLSRPGRSTHLRAAEVDWLETGADSTTFHQGESSFRSETPFDVEDQLDPGLFVRIHAGAMVNVERIREVHPLRGGRHSVILGDGTELIAERGYRDPLLKALSDRPIAHPRRVR